MTAVHADATPLELIERTVLEQAKGINLDLGDDAARARMRELICDAVARWSSDYRRGLRTHDLADPDLVIERAHRNLVGYGPLESLLEDDDVWEMLVVRCSLRRTLARKPSVRWADTSWVKWWSSSIQAASGWWSTWWSTSTHGDSKKAAGGAAIPGPTIRLAVLIGWR